MLLTGIVGLNVVSLSLSASQGKLSQQATLITQENSALRARLAERLSSERVRHAAAGLGMAVPDSTDVNYRDASGDTVRLAARRLADGFGLGGTLVAVPTTLIPTTTTETITPVATSTTAAPTSITAAPSTTVSAPTTTAPAPASGGGVAPG